MFRNMKIGSRLLSGFGLVLLLMAAVAGVGYWGMRSITNETLDMLHGDAAMESASNRANSNVLGMRRFEKDTFLNIDDKAIREEYITKWQGQLDATKKEIAELEKTANLKEEEATIQTMKAELAFYQSHFEKAIVKVRAGEIKTPQQGNEFIGSAKDQIHALEKAADDLATSNREQMAAREKTLPVVVSRATTIMLVVLIAAFAVGLFISLFITRGITQPIQNVVLAAQKVREGDLRIDIVVDRQDETGELLLSFKTMIESLNTMARAASSIAQGDLSVKIKPYSEHDVLGNALAEMSQRLRQVIAEVLSGASALSSAANQVSSASQTLAQGTTEQAASIEETSASLEQMNASITQNADNSRQTEHMAIKGAQNAAESGKAVSESVSAMKEITQK